MSLIHNQKSFIIAVVCTVIVAVALGSIVIGNNKNNADKSSDRGKYEYIVAVKDIKKGDSIKEEDVEIKDLGIEMTDAYKHKGDVVGRVAESDILPQKPIIKNFLKAIEPIKTVTYNEPQSGYRAIPFLIKKASMPPYLSVNQKFDLITKENSMRIENLRILDILDTTTNDGNKILLFEIKNSDLPTYVKYQNSSNGFIFLKKNPSEYGEYRFLDLAKQTGEPKTASSGMPSKMPDGEYLPPISDIVGYDGENDSSGSKLNNTETSNKKEVEVIIGDTKTKLEFNE